MADLDLTPAVEEFRKWYFNHTGKRIFHSNAKVAVKVVIDALRDARNAALVSEAVAEEREACANECDIIQGLALLCMEADFQHEADAYGIAARAIRARTPTPEKPEGEHEG